MAVLVMVYGHSGSGKSASLRNFDTEQVAVLLGNTEARPTYWFQDSLRTNSARSNAAHTLLELGSNAGLLGE